MKKWNSISKTKQIQRELQSEIDQIAPDIFSNILECVKEEKKETPIEWYEKYTIRRREARKSKRKIWAAAAACLVLGIGAAWQYDMNYSTACTVMLDVNPSIQMEVSKSGRILSMQSNNTDGESIIDTIKEEKSLNKALLKAMEELEKEKYFEQEESAMLLSYVPKKDVRRVNEIMESTVEEYQKNHEKCPKAIILKVIVNSQVEKLSQKESVSVGKSAFCIKTAAKVPKTAEELSTQNISDIAKTYYDENYPSQDEDIRLKQREKQEKETSSKEKDIESKASDQKKDNTQKQEKETKQAKTTIESSQKTVQNTTKETTEEKTKDNSEKTEESKEIDTTVKAGITTADGINQLEGTSTETKESTSHSTSHGTALKIKKIIVRKNQQLVIKFNKKTVWDEKFNMKIMDKDKNVVHFIIVSQTEDKWVVQASNLLEGEKYQIVIEGIKAQGAKTYKPLKKKFVNKVKETSAISESTTSAEGSISTSSTSDTQKNSDKGVTTKKPMKTSSHTVEKNEHQNEIEGGENTGSMWNPQETTTVEPAEGQQ